MEIETIAALCHEVNRAYCASIGDHSHPAWVVAPDWQKDSIVNGVRFHMENEATPAMSHESWLRQKMAEGWVYGEVKDPVAKTHPCVVPYDQLPQEQRSKDYLFKAVCAFFKGRHG